MTTNKTKWVIDPAHTEIQFKVKHLVISTVTGSFEKFEGSMQTTEEDFSDAEVLFTADVNSVNTNMPDRDAHLKSAEFFDGANHPKLTFRSKKIMKQKSNVYELTGDLTLKGITREIILDVSFGGIMKDPYGNIKAGFQITGKLNRMDFDLKWNVVTEAGGLVVSEDVTIIVNAELIKQ